MDCGTACAKISKSKQKYAAREAILDIAREHGIDGTEYPVETICAYLRRIPDARRKLDKVLRLHGIA